MCGRPAAAARARRNGGRRKAIPFVFARSSSIDDEANTKNCSCRSAAAAATTPASRHAKPCRTWLLNFVGYGLPEEQRPCAAGLRLPRGHGGTEAAGRQFLLFSLAALRSTTKPTQRTAVAVPLRPLRPLRPPGTRSRAAHG